MSVTSPLHKRRTGGTLDLPRSVVEYLAASGVFAVCVARNADGTVGFRMTADIGRRGEDCVHTYWVADKAAATAVVRAAVSLAGDRPTQQGAVDALFRAAASKSIHLSTHDGVIKRATAAAARLDSSLAAAAAGGRLKQFHGEYRRRRIAASTNGKSFMSFTTAKRRFRRAIVSRLLNDAPAANIFDEVFHG
jgi:hypothetical protein